ncbi:MAG: hypothetical protein K0R50_4483 [Eubacterium sp.]|nr:hypothetical protein [Eubacterium sp.]
MLEKNIAFNGNLPAGQAQIRRAGFQVKSYKACHISYGKEA